MPERHRLLGIEVPGLYDGVAVWIWSDGVLENRFDSPGWETTNLRRRTDAWIAEHGAALRREHGLEDPDA